MIDAERNGNIRQVADAQRVRFPFVHLEMDIAGAIGRNDRGNLLVRRNAVVFHRHLCSVRGDIVESDLPVRMVLYLDLVVGIVRGVVVRGISLDADRDIRILIQDEVPVLELVVLIRILRKKRIVLVRRKPVRDSVSAVLLIERSGFARAVGSGVSLRRIRRILAHELRQRQQVNIIVIDEIPGDILLEVRIDVVAGIRKPVIFPVELRPVFAAVPLVITRQDQLSAVNLRVFRIAVSAAVLVDHQGVALLKKTVRGMSRLLVCGQKLAQHPVIAGVQHLLAVLRVHHDQLRHVVPVDVDHRVAVRFLLVIRCLDEIVIQGRIERLVIRLEARGIQQRKRVVIGKAGIPRIGALRVEIRVILPPADLIISVLERLNPVGGCGVHVVLALLDLLPGAVFNPVENILRRHVRPLVRLVVGVCHKRQLVALLPVYDMQHLLVRVISRLRERGSLDLRNAVYCMVCVDHRLLRVRRIIGDKLRNPVRVNVDHAVLRLRPYIRILVIQLRQLSRVGRHPL